MSGVCRLITRTAPMAAATLLLLVSAAMAQHKIHWPDTAPDDYVLAFVDVETTGLVPGAHEMIDIGLIYTDLEGKELGRLFQRVMPERPDIAQPGAVAVNAFNVERWDSLGALTKTQLVEEISALHKSVVLEGQKALLVAFNSQFDAAYLDHLFREADPAEDSWRDLYFYYVLDLPSMAWMMGERALNGADLAKAFEIEPETNVPTEHTGITGAQFNVDLYRAMLARRGTMK